MTPMLKAVLTFCSVVALGCQVAPQVPAANTFAWPGQGRLSTTVAVKLNAPRDFRLMQTAAAASEASVSSLSVELGLKPAQNTPFVASVSLPNVPRTGNQFSFTLTNLDFSTTYWLRILALDASNVTIGRIPSVDGFQAFTTGSESQSQLQQTITVGLKLDDVTFNGAAPVNVTFTPGAVLRPSTPPVFNLPPAAMK